MHSLRISLYASLLTLVVWGFPIPGFSLDRPMGEHQAILSKNPDEITAWKLELLKNAERRIYMMAGYAEGNLLKKVLTIFEEQLPQKPELKIWFFASDFPGFVTDEARARMDALSQAYPGRFHYLAKAASANYKQAEGLFNTENHVKLLIADEKYFILGGTNLVDNLSRSETLENTSVSGTFLPKAALDQDVLLWGPAALALKEDFFRVWGVYEENASFENRFGAFYPQKAMPDLLPEEEKVVIAQFESHPDRIFPVKAKAFIAGPRVNPHEVQNEYANAIDSAKKEIQIGHLYFFPIPKIFDRLLAAANRNIAIKAMTNGFWKELTLKEATLWLFVQRSRIHYFPLMMGRHFSLIQSVEARQLPQKNVEVYELNEDYMMYHKKTMTVDGAISLIGSFNFGQKSAFSDYELLAVLDSEKAAATVNTLLDSDRKKGTRITRDVAYGWYYNPAYVLAGSIEGFFADGTILAMKKPPKPVFVEPSVAEMESFLLKK